ncbi:MAG: ATP-binding protein [Cellvibrionaceae bacterium]|nr:ATP-binding protein [Cellvibrionaceae bacterium]
MRRRAALELSVSGAPLKQMLDVFIEAVETQSGGRVRSSILLVNDSRDRLVCGAAPSLPEALRNAIDGLPIGPHSAVCGTAAYLRQAIFVGDFTADSRCAAYRDLAVSSGIQACWSTPVFSSEGTLLAVFALYYPHTLAEPFVGDAQMVEILGSTVALIIDKTIDTRLRREAEQKLRASEAALREADKRKDEFLATLAHELRNPLAPISNALQIMRLSPDVGAVNDMRELINRQLTQMVRLVDDLMDVSRITRGKVDLRRERVSLASVLQNTVEVVRPLVDERAQTLRVQLPDRPVWLHADFTRLSQVFTNIVNNACKYTQTGGAIAIAASAQGGAVAVTVEDNGMGIPADKLPLIFEMFSQVEDPIGRTHGGLGIGLTLAEQLVKMHGGHVEAHSDGPGKGSRFTVYLPLETGADAGGPAQGRREARPGAGLRVLVVDDNRESARTLAQLIELLGHHTQVAFDGAEALELADQLVPDLVLMDLGMPGMDGFETCKAMKRNPLLRDAVLVAQTGWGEKRHNQLAQEAGFAHHLVKPIDLQALEELLADIAPATDGAGAGRDGSS